MSTFLQIVQKVNSLSGAQGSVVSLSTVTGYQATLKELVSSAWLDIQNLRTNWNFLKTNLALTTTAGKAVYNSDDLFGVGVENSIKELRYVLDSDSNPLKQVTDDYYIFKDILSNSQSKPELYSYDRNVDYTFKINPPDQAYVLNLYYRRKPQTLLLNEDVPKCPTEFHDAITYRALVDVGVYFGNSNLYQGFLGKSDSLIGSLMRSQIPAAKIRTRGIV